MELSYLFYQVGITVLLDLFDGWAIVDDADKIGAYSFPLNHLLVGDMIFHEPHNVVTEVRSNQGVNLFRLRFWAKET